MKAVIMAEARAPSAPHYPGAPKPIGAPSGQAGHGAYHRPAQAPWDHGYLRHPPIHARGGAELVWRRRGARGAPDLFLWAGTPGHGGQCKTACPTWGRRLPGDQRGCRAIWTCRQPWAFTGPAVPTPHWSSTATRSRWNTAWSLLTIPDGWSGSLKSPAGAKSLPTQ